VLEAMRPYFCEEWGNPSSAYRFGSKLKGVIETARAQVAELIGAHPREIIFTSCATESNNAAIHAALKAHSGKRHIVTSAVEHSSVLNYCKALEKDGCRVTYLPVDRDGLLNLADLESAVTDQTAVVSLMWANNETGVLFPVKQIAELCRARGVLYHCDAVQAAGKVEIDLSLETGMQADYLSLTGHKFHAPKGIGALYVRRKAPFSPLLHGGHQERNLRGGTECVPLIAGLGKAAELAWKRVPGYDKKIRPLRDALEEGILRSIPNTELNGHKTQRLANTTNITFRGLESEALLILLDKEGICASSGSACLADSDQPSHVVKAMKPDSAASRQMIRLSLDTASTTVEVKKALSAVEHAVRVLRC
ncbi:MAG TPA: aminotransferase class V-fold PLP-dependent enzyme, partial [Verrucomicrobiota bacterium]|nr:aminotransferase class V-fold PLP-dependent enzyme [Verrucomicrobiota bacterium]